MRKKKKKKKNKLFSILFHSIKLILNYIKNKLNVYKYLKWGLGIGDWGLGIGDWAQSPIPNPQSPIPNPQSFIKNENKK